MTLSTRLALEAVRRSSTLLEAMRLAPALDRAAGLDDVEAATAALADAVADEGDQLTAALAVLALGVVRSGRAGSVLTSLLLSGEPSLQDHAADALGRGPLVVDALQPLTAAVALGGFRGMLAQRTLQVWAQRHPDAVGEALESLLQNGDRSDGRAALVETLGLVPGPAAHHRLRQIAVDETEPLPTRAAAVAALGEVGLYAVNPPAADATGTREVLMKVVDQTGPLTPVALLALGDLTGRAAPISDPAGERADDLTVAQLFLHADVDGNLSHAGRADTGGIATLLVQLGDALLEAEPPVTRVLTLSRGGPADAVDGLVTVADPGHRYLPIPLWGPSRPAALAWPLRVAAARGLRRILLAAGRVDALHLRMGDVGSMAAAEVASELNIPIVFTLAPDPHALVASRDAAGTLTRGDFGATDAIEHLIFRERLLRELQAKSAHLVLFPRPALQHDMRALMNLDITAEARRVSVVAEGISLSVIDSAQAQALSRTAPRSPALLELDGLLDRLPPERRNLPLAVSVGRLTRVKGMATLVEAWADGSGLEARCNLLLVGGDLTDPTADEQEQLAAIASTVPLDLAPGRGLLLSGHRPNGTVAAWLLAVRQGRPGLAAPGGVYVSASLKEEFGIAILEAMATGLVVVAPSAGGPATYVTDGVTGILADTGSRDRLGHAVTQALDLAAAPGADDRAAQARAMVRERFGIETMAAALSDVYHRVAAERAATEPAAVRETAPARRVPSDGDARHKAEVARS